MSEISPFKSALSKLARARRVAAAIEHDITSYSGAALHLEQAKPGRVEWTVRITHDPSEDLATAAGDVIHNCRSALDYSAISAVASIGGNTNNVYFPFASDSTELETQIKRKNFHRAPTEAQDLIRQLRPYAGGNDHLRALHDLDIMDKHVDLISLSGAAVQSEDIMLGTSLISGCGVGLMEGAVLLSTPGVVTGPTQKMGVELEAYFSFHSPFPMQPLVPTLLGLIELSEGIVESFAALVGRE